MSSASYPFVGSTQGVPTYANLASFPSPVIAGNGALAIALDTDILYISNGSAWEVLANPVSANAITALTGDVTATGPGSVPASLVATSNGTLTTLSALTTASNLASVGTITSGTWNATTVTINHGGTGQTTAAAAFNALNPMTTTGDLIYESGTNTATRLGIGSSGNILTVSGGVPIWSPPATSGTVTSVNVSGGTTGLTTSGGPVTSSGTITIARTLGIANGGTGQTSANPAFNALAPSTTKGDLIAFSTVNARLGVGSDGQVLTADSAQTTGIKWATPTTGTVTSINVSGGTTGLTFTGGPITTSGTITAGGTLAVANGGTGVTSSTGTTNVVLSNGPTLVAPVLGTPASGTLTNCTGLPIGGGTTGTLGADRGGTGVANNSASTLTISGNFGTTLTVSGTTSLTLPTTGTVANLASSQVFTNKDLTATSNSFTAYNPANSGGTSGVVSGTNGLKGFTDASSGAAGYLGEVMNTTFGPGNYTASGNYQDTSSFNLTAGDWMLTHQVYFSAAGAAYSNCKVGISTNTGNTSSGLTMGDNLASAGNNNLAGYDLFASIAQYHVNISTTTTYYGKLNATFTGGSPVYYGRFTAQRIR